jgi:hypothetical protein
MGSELAVAGVAAAAAAVDTSETDYGAHRDRFQ